MSLSVCMIVRDEEKNLTRCLESVKPIADEIIIVDTGSKDKTIEFAKQYGAFVLESAWQDSFSYHRNESLKEATCSWCLVIDADEELKGNVAGLKNSLDKMPAATNAIALQIQDIHQGQVKLKFNVPKLFRRGKVTYKEIVHNEAEFEGDSILFQDVFVAHYGYDTDEATKQKKIERTLSLLNKRLTEKSDDYKTHFYLAQIYGELGDIEQMIEHFEIYIFNKAWVKNFNESAYHSLLQGYIAKKDYLKADKLFYELISVNKTKNLDVYKSLLEFGIAIERQDLILEGANGFVTLFDEYKSNPAIAGNSFIYNFNYESLSFCLYYLSLMQISMGFNALKRLKQDMKHTRIQYQNMVNSDLRKELKKIGIKRHV